jgi:hypothetical protein
MVKWNLWLWFRIFKKKKSSKGKHLVSVVFFKLENYESFGFRFKKIKIKKKICSITNKNLEFQNEHMGLILANCWLKFINGSRVNFGFFNIFIYHWLQMVYLNIFFKQEYFYCV